MFHNILQVVPTDNYQIYLYFSDGTIKLFNAEKLVQKGVFQQIRDLEIFKNACTVLNDTLAWDLTGEHNPAKCLDLDPEVLYETSCEVSESSVPIAG